MLVFISRPATCYASGNGFDVVASPGAIGEENVRSPHIHLDVMVVAVVNHEHESF